MPSPEAEGVYWDDVRVTANMVAVSGSQFSQPPVFTGILVNAERGPSFSGLYGYRFGYGTGVFQSAHFQVQLPHTYRRGSPIEPHVHVRLDPSSEGAAGQKLLLEFEYVWLNVGELRAASTRIIAINHEVTAEELARDNVIVSFGLLEKAEADISSMLDCRFSRITFDPAWGRDFWTPQGLDNDSFQGGLVFKEFDFHYQRDSAGSREPYHT